MDRGSQRWIQIAVNRYPDVISHAVRRTINEPIEWLSPLAVDDFAEYRDGDALNLLGVEPARMALSEYWPEGGSQWDALGRTAHGSPVLVEAKAHVSELASGVSRARSAKSIELISSGLEATREWIGAEPLSPWNGPYYQYVNRLAMLHFLDHVNEIPSFLVYIYFLGDSYFIGKFERKGPATESQWLPAIRSMKASLGISNLPANVGEIFVPVTDLVDAFIGN
jgi:hypothetical protein